MSHAVRDLARESAIIEERAAASIWVLVTALALLNFQITFPFIGRWPDYSSPHKMIFFENRRNPCSERDTRIVGYKHVVTWPYLVS